MIAAAGAGRLLDRRRDDELVQHRLFAFGRTQDPAEALYPAMPASAAAAVDVDAALGVEALAAALDEAARVMPPRGGGDVPAFERHPETERGATRLTCPDCGGVLFEEEGGGGTRFACSVGHVFAPESLDIEQARQLESALWAAVRSLEDRADLLERLGRRATHRANQPAAAAHRAEAEDCLRRADQIRRIIAEPDVVT